MSSIPRSPDERIPPIHPGEFLREDLMKPLGLSARALAAALHVPAVRIAAIAGERGDLSVEMALCLERYFGMSARFWMNRQKHYDLTVAEGRLGQAIRREVRPWKRGDARKAGSWDQAPFVPRAFSAQSRPDTKTLRHKAAFAPRGSRTGKLEPVHSIAVKKDADPSTRLRQEAGANSLRMTK